MKCPYCFKRVAKRPESCPHCGYDLASVMPAKPQDTEAMGRLRTILVVGGVAAVAVGIFARTPGSADTSQNRLLAKKHVGDGFEALTQGRYGDAREKLDLAIKEDVLFAEAYLGRAMACLALGDIDCAEGDARFAATLFEDGRYEPRGWGDRSDAEVRGWGKRIAGRATCICGAARQVADLTTEHFGIVFKVFYDARAVTDCAKLQALIDPWRKEARAYRVLRLAVERCPELWSCR